MVRAISSPDRSRSITATWRGTVPATCGCTQAGTASPTPPAPLGKIPRYGPENVPSTLANSSLSTPAANPKALVLSLNITFPQQDHLATGTNADFAGPHEA